MAENDNETLVELSYAAWREDPAVALLVARVGSTADPDGLEALLQSAFEAGHSIGWKGGAGMTDKKPLDCLHCAIIAAINAYSAAYGHPSDSQVIHALAEVAKQIMRHAAGGEQYPGDPPASSATH